MFEITNHKLSTMRKILILILFIGILGCVNKKKEQTSTVKIKDEKAQKISEMMKSYVNNNLNSSIISDDAIIKFNKIKMTKTGFEDLVKTHHAMFSEISFPEGWMETINNTGNDVKNAGGIYADGYGSTWTSHWSEWTAVSKISGDTISNSCFFGYKWQNEKIIEVSAIFPDEAFNKELAIFMETNK